MGTFLPRPARSQPPLVSQPYDRWTLPDGRVKAEFHRAEYGFLLRFPDEADFAIHADGQSVTGWPAPDVSGDHFRSLYSNAVLPLLGDYNGGLFLHGSAVVIGGRAVAFLGKSGDGKTTLAAAFAKAGHPFLTEDVIELALQDEKYLLQPKSSGLRLFADSAAYLLEEQVEMDACGHKFDVADAATLPFCGNPAPLVAIFMLGADHSAPLALAPMSATASVHQLLSHSFVLDVEDKQRLRMHFHRIAALASGVRCYMLDYCRNYADLPRVIAATSAEVARAGAMT